MNKILIILILSTTIAFGISLSGTGGGSGGGGVDKSITNGLAPITYVNDKVEAGVGVDKSITNGLAPITYVNNNYMPATGDVAVDGNFKVNDGYEVELPSVVTKGGNNIPISTDLQSTFDCVVPDDYDGVASALIAGKSSIFLKPGYYTNSIYAPITINRPVFIKGSGRNSTHMIFKIYYGQGDGTEDGALSIVGGKQFIIRDLDIVATNGTSGRKNFIYIYNTTDGYNFLSERCNYRLSRCGNEQIRGILKTTGNCGERNVTFDKCNIILDYVNNNSVPGWLLDFGSTITPESMVVLRDCNYYNNSGTYRDIMINCGTLIINGCNLYLSDGKITDDNSYSITTYAGMKLFSFTDNNLIMNGTHNYAALVSVRADNNYINNSSIISYNTQPPTKGDIRFLGPPNAIVANCKLQGIKGFKEYYGTAKSTTNLVIGCKIDYTAGYKVNAQPLEFHNNIINNVYTP